jgi:hypothetical protein
MKHRFQQLCTLSLSGALLLASCVQPLPQHEAPSSSPPAVPAAVEEPIAASTFELRRREHAHALKRQGRWTEAAAEWEILVLLRPDRAEYQAELSEAQGHIQQRVFERLQFAADARRRGETERAQLLYLKVLGLEPGNAVAAQGLREIEAERTRRSRF